MQYYVRTNKLFFYHKYILFTRRTIYLRAIPNRALVSRFEALPSLKYAQRIPNTSNVINLVQLSKLKLQVPQQKIVKQTMP